MPTNYATANDPGSTVYSTVYTGVLAPSVIERIFGVLKERFPIVKQGCRYIIGHQIGAISAARRILHMTISSSRKRAWTFTAKNSFLPSLRHTKLGLYSRSHQLYEANDPKRKLESMRASEEAKEAGRGGVSTWEKLLHRLEINLEKGGIKWQSRCGNSIAVLGRI